MSMLNKDDFLITDFFHFYPEGTLATITLTILDISKQPVTEDYKIDNCREKKVPSGGEQNRGTLASENFTWWQIPSSMLAAANCPDPTLGSQITGPEGRQWSIISIREQLQYSERPACWNCYCERLKNLPQA
jgi:hypothetical protein